ncbi:helix-turn-helix transcriptional regulator [Clostridium perfringens]|nr:helix-turn-helix transcriptional regulator [Clostridium perfringens]MDK0768121.1 helix-turn-helix transcriptional regulator [Clostridium perfringens]MDK0770767.1 helix-turn-helix transcriptional regulator [Clostridium perfringens]MDK0775792.1 helix-turn-helix transcriptional regulator [Clostridium perfringens]
MIRIKLSELLGKHKMTRKKLAELIDVRPNTIGDLYNEKVKKIDIEILDKLCEVFECEVEDIIEHIK